MEVQEVKIGEGAYSTVYSTGTFAIKRVTQIPEEKVEDALILLKKEVEVYLQCKHPNIIEMQTWGKDFIILTLMEGSIEKLHEDDQWTFYLYRNKIITDVAHGLRHLHSCGWAHMDLSHNNVLYKFEDEKPVFRICDMGFAVNEKILADEEYYPGTFVYMDYVAISSWFRKTMKTCFLTDIWSLGNLIGRVYNHFPFTHQLVRRQGIKGEDINILRKVGPVIRDATQEDYDGIVIQKHIPPVAALIMRVKPAERPTLDEIIEKLEAWKFEKSESSESSDGEPSRSSKENDSSEN